MKDYKRLTDRDDDGIPYVKCADCYIRDKCDSTKEVCYQELQDRLAEIEDKIESGEIVDRNAYLDYLMSTSNVSEVTDKEIEFFAKHNARVREYVDMEIARLTAENAELKARLERAIELPYVKRDCELTQIIYKNSYGDMEEETYFHDCYYGERHDVRGDVYAETMLEELKGGKQ